MKVEIDLNEILGDEENGFENLQESIRRQVIDAVKAQVKTDVAKKIDEAVSQTISSGINEYLKVEMPNLLANIMDAEFQPVSRWGEKAQPTSFRKQLVAQIHEEMKYEKKSWDSDKNAFTKAIDETVKGMLDQFKTSFHKKLDSDFTAAAMEYATQKLKEKLKIVA